MDGWVAVLVIVTIENIATSALKVGLGLSLAICTYELSTGLYLEIMEAVLYLFQLLQT